MQQAVNQLGLYETDPQEWSLAGLQRWINEAEHLLARMPASTDSQAAELRRLVERELGRKKKLLTRIWVQ